MNLKNLKCISNNVNLDDYYKLYDYVLDNMEHKEWLDRIPREEVEKILVNSGRIWIYYDLNNIVCSMFYIPANSKTLRKHNIETDEKLTGSLGPIMVNPNYIGNRLMKQMMEVFNIYNKQIGNKYIFTKAMSDNIYSIRNIEKNGYKLCHVYDNDRGNNSAFIKHL